MTDLKLVKSDMREIDDREAVNPEHIVAFEIYMLEQSIARIIELSRLYPEIMAVNWLFSPSKPLLGVHMLALSECFEAFTAFYAALVRRK